MVVWLFGILWISHFLMHLEAVSAQERHRNVRATLYVGLPARQENGDFEETLTGKFRLGLVQAEDRTGNNAARSKRELRRRLFGQTARGSRKSTSASLESSTKEPIDLPDTYILVVNISVGSKELTLPKQKLLTEIISRGLEIEQSGCFVLHLIPISGHRVQVSIYCKKMMAKLISSDQKLNVMIPAKSLVRSLNRPQIKPVLKKLNVTAYGVLETPGLELAVYQEMWFPVAVVAGVSILLVFMAIICLLLCRWKLDARAEEEKKAETDPELLYPSVRPMNTISARMVQPGATRDYTIAGVPPKPKWKGSQLSLSDRRGSKASLVLDLRSSTTDLVSTSPAPSILESPTEEKLASKTLPLSFSALEDCVHSTKQLYSEFWDLPMNRPPAQDRLPGSSYRNRYPSILPNSRSRVKLEEIPDDSLSTYINANFIKGYGGVPQAYIATQGPLSCTLNDFWRMIWQYRCPVIVMITKLQERKETKCERYWPDPTFRMQEKYGDMVVTFDSAIGRDGYQITSLIISHSQSLEAPRRVYHYWYTAWPDHGVPESPRQLLRLTEEVSKARERDDVKGKPVVVHCSAGVGRTGCFIATSIGKQQILKEEHVNILKIVSLMRINRGGMVETDDQYEFVYRALHHYWRGLRFGGGNVPAGRDVVLEAIFDED